MTLRENFGQFNQKILPKKWRKSLNRRFENKKKSLYSDQDDASFDLIRASVNLVVASALISLATSMKLPLSTTYVTFMVAMISSPSGS